MADHLLDEVNADVRAAQLENLWQRYRKPLAVAIIGVLVLTAVNSIWQHYQEKRGGELLLALVDAKALYDAGKFTDAAQAFEAAAGNAHGENRALTTLWQGRALIAAGEKQKAIAVLKETAQEKNLWSDLACLRLAGLDEASATCLAATHDSPLASQRRAWQAASDWKSGKTTQAIETLEELATSSSEPEASRAQINQWLATLRATQSTPAK